MTKLRRQQLHPMTAGRLSVYNAQYVSGYDKTAAEPVTAGRNHYGKGVLIKSFSKYNGGKYVCR